MALGSPIKTLRPNPLTLLGAGVGLVALLELPIWSPGWLLFKANRIVAGDSFSPFSLSPFWTLTLAALWLLVALFSLVPLPKRPWLQSGLMAALVLAASLFVGNATTGLLDDAARSARVSLEGGIWLTVLAVYITLFGASNEAGGGWRNLGLAAPSLLVLSLAFLMGTFGELGIARELASQGGTFPAELRRHLALSLTSVLLASLIGIPAAIWAAREARVAGLVLPTAGLLQTVPSLALFGILLAPLAQLGRTVTLAQAVTLMLASFGLMLVLLALRALLKHSGPVGQTGLSFLAIALSLPSLVIFTVLGAVYVNALILGETATLNIAARWSEPLASFGVRGIGAAPALIALTLYALLPIVRNTYTGVREVSPAVTEAGRGMGMSPAQVLGRLELPLALPLILEGLRASAVLTIGITTVAALIGAGGLGFFVLRGIDQVVPDLILLGALPIILLALLADGLLKLLGLLLTPKGLRS